MEKVLLCIKRKTILILLAIVCLLGFYRLPHNLRIRQTSFDEITETGYFIMQCYSSDIDWSERTCYPGQHVTLEIGADKITDIISFFPSMTGYRLFPFEWTPTGLNRRYPAPVAMEIAFGRYEGSSYNLRFYVVQKERGYSVYMQNHGWYVLTDADAFIDTVLSNYPDKGIRIPSIRIGMYQGK